jgi:hypothetical protein
MVGAMKRRGRGYGPRGLFTLAIGRWPAVLGGDRAEKAGQEAVRR